MQEISENTFNLTKTSSYAFPDEGNISLDVNDPMILASSYMLYEIGKFDLYFAVFNYFSSQDHFHQMQYTVSVSCRCGDFNRPPFFRAPWTILIVVSGTYFSQM